MKIVEDDLEFNFTDAKSVRKFDDKNHGLLNHGMSAVDFIIELDQAYLFVEVKDPSNPKGDNCNLEADKNKLTSTSRDYRENMKLCLQKKFRDTFIYFWAENHDEKPIHFLSVITLEQALLNNFEKNLKDVLPIKTAPSWKKQLVNTCAVLNIDSWNRNFPKWQIQRISEQNN